MAPQTPPPPQLRSSAQLSADMRYHKIMYGISYYMVTITVTENQNVLRNAEQKINIKRSEKISFLLRRLVPVAVKAKGHDTNVN
jgi:hypothetical protein